jgi:acyl-CoA thioester hydrolase
MDSLYHHSSGIQIRFNDVDMLGHVTNSAYPQYFDLGRMAYINEVFGEQISWDRQGLILVSISIDFMNSIKLYDKVKVRTKVVRIGNKSLEMVQDIYNETTNLVAAKSKAIMVGYNGVDEVSIPIPELWRQKIADFEKALLA